MCDLFPSPRFPLSIISSKSPVIDINILHNKMLILVGLAALIWWLSAKTVTAADSIAEMFIYPDPVAAVSFYPDLYFEGDPLIFDAPLNRFCFNLPQSWDNRISSLKVIGDHSGSCRFYKDYDCEGPLADVLAFDSKFRNLCEDVRPFSGCWNDVISSYVCFKNRPIYDPPGGGGGGGGSPPGGGVPPGGNPP
ncbi:hypothetical protein BJ170DRAFT_611980 [Xylariales sp. AK1849]|nr:hypothetical protein BJ170DRAFT_611980 [Xylariales sp. AK1849]